MAIESLTALWTAVTGMVGSVTATLTSLTALWFVFVPMVLAVGRAIIGNAKSLLFYRRGRRRG